jgi:hypothetical protein
MYILNRGFVLPGCDVPPWRGFDAMDYTIEQFYILALKEEGLHILEGWNLDGNIESDWWGPSYGLDAIGELITFYNKYKCKEGFNNTIKIPEELKADLICNTK